MYKDVNKHPCINAVSLTQERYLPTPRATCKNTPTSDMPDKPCVTRRDGVFWNVGVFYQHLAAVWKLGEMSEKGAEKVKSLPILLARIRAARFPVAAVTLLQVHNCKSAIKKKNSVMTLLILYIFFLPA